MSYGTCRKSSAYVRPHVQRDSIAGPSAQVTGPTLNGKFARTQTMPHGLTPDKSRLVNAPLVLKPAGLRTFHMLSHHQLWRQGVTALRLTVSLGYPGDLEFGRVFGSPYQNLSALRTARSPQSESLVDISQNCATHT